MEIDIIKKEALRFRNAIERAKKLNEFVHKRFYREPMNNFPIDCCDDTTYLFAHFMFNVHFVDSVIVRGSYYNIHLHHECYHVWQEIDGYLVDLTGDQFDKDDNFPIKETAIYVGEMDKFHLQFRIIEKTHCCGIESINTSAHSRMYNLYNIIMNHY